MCGELSAVQLLDVMSLIKTKMGKLVMKTGTHTYVLHLAHHNITGLVCDNERITDAAEVKRRMLDLLAVQEATFEMTCVRPAFLIVEGVLSDVAVPLQDFLPSQTGALPEPTVEYKALNGVEAWLVKDDLDDFWHAAKELLNVGANAKAIAQHLGLSVGRVRFKMHHLRELGAIKAI